MANPGPQSGVNAWLEEELLQQYHHDRTSVDSDWKDIFEHEGSNGVALTKSNGRTGNGNGASYADSAVAVAEPPALPAAVEPVLSRSEELMPLRGVSARIAENMAISATIPLATSQRIIPVKVIDENRRLINHHRALLGKSKVSYTHLIGWAIIRSWSRKASAMAASLSWASFSSVHRGSSARLPLVATSGRSKAARSSTWSGE